MSPRRARRRAEPPRPAAPPAAVVEEADDGEWMVRSTVATKSYRCPGCDQEVRPGVAHVVAWQPGDADDRRHWHAPCWQARGRRGVKVHRSKNAPRYG